MAHLLAALRGPRGTAAALQAFPGWLHGTTAAADAAAAAATAAGWQALELTPAAQQQARSFARFAPVNDPYHTEPTNYVQLLQHIYHAKRLQRIDDLLQDYGDKFDALHVAAAMAAAPRLLGKAVERGGGLAPKQAQQPREVLEQLQDMVELHAERLQVRQIANVIWSLGKCHKILEARQKRSRARQVAMVLLAELGRGGHRKLYQGGAGARDAAQLLHGMAQLHMRRPSTLTALAAVVRADEAAEARHLALAAWGFGRLLYRDPELLRVIGDRLSANKLYLRPWSMAAALRTYVLQNIKHEALAAAVAEEAVEQVRSFRPKELAAVSWALGRHGLIDPEAASKLLATFRASALQQLEGFGAAELGLLLEGLEALGGAGDELLAAVAEGIAEEQEVVVAPADAARILGAFLSAKARGGSAPGGAAAAAMLERVAAAAARCAPAFSPSEVESVAVCAGKLYVAYGGGAGSGGGGDADGDEEAYGGRVKHLMHRLGSHAASRPELYSLRRVARLLGSFSAVDVVHARLTEAAGARLSEECGALLAGPGQQQQQQRQQQQQEANPGRDLEGPIDLGVRLAALKRLRPDPAAALAGAALPRLAGLKARKLSMLLGALCSKGDLLTEEPVRELLLAAAFGRAVEHGLLAGRGPPLIGRLLRVAADEAGGGGAALPPRHARDVLAAMEAPGVEAPAGLRATVEAVLAGAARREAEGSGGDLMEAWEEPH